MHKTVVIDCFQTGAALQQPDLFQPGYTIVAIDVIRATTMAVTAVALGRACYPVTSVDEAFALAKQLKHPILAGELGGDMPSGFEMSNSPAELVVRTDVERPLILLSSSGTQLMARSRHADEVYLSCFRNYSATARQICGRHSKIAIIGAGSRGEFRREDQIGCAWVAQALMEHGYTAQDQKTYNIVQRWKGKSALACADGNSAKYLRRSGQVHDLHFVLQNINDLDAAVKLDGNQVVVTAARPVVAAAALAASAQCAGYDANQE